MSKEVKTVGTKEALGAGVFGLGLLTIFLPSAVQRIADMGIGETFAMLSGSVMTVSVFILIAGLAIMFAKFD